MDKAIRDKYTAVIGLEVHAQLLTKSKIYNADAAAYGNSPNTNVGVITLAHPGVLPKLNKKSIEYAIKMGLACNCEISRFNIFDRKNYFYPDLPKGYQLTQDRTPICKGGYIAISTSNGERNITLNRIHIEEDAGKSIHLENENDTLVDLNRAGVPLIEIVTEPSIRSSEEASALLTEIRKIVRYLEICDGNMEEGSLRCDANVSVMLKDAKEYGKKVEVKNMNSIRNVQRAIDYEIERQIELIESGANITSETRTFDAGSGKTYGMREKEELNDYRYFPDPDLSPLVVSEEWLASIKASMPALPRELVTKYVKSFHLPEYDAQVITDSKDVAHYFEEACQYTVNYKAVSNWVMGTVKSYLNETNSLASDLPVSPKTLAEVINLIDGGKISYTMAQQRLFPALLENSNKVPITLAQELNILQDSSADSILPIVEEVIKEFPLKVEEFKNGKKGIIAMFMGEVMKRSKGKADPKVANELLTKKLKEVQ
ncbi:Asp-tRNA(Asn)/Glu-tRNA(Gln) amidotransferase subunit GatB [Chryseosolibacter indicus]|uniref:Aspartyl/glutamyl-tRNA(Asn/Gln) amidotransferase subunit B n=1 Tax=Chryseosolibacter indicus TaxID=2782351 RepID=A0ABS5VJK3_9BACT|nr:Asp-tRNA(Asn)/Glu-tRNA(Gln) amidotransferase subunit GatB [Chryseosolibacter indicus]MBT1701638.1 Asp-tRNA(Asn)/Glu-tRNA(Gln) amidotransferase subunit GatB [Chryseosolibacter indicus]